VLHALRHLGVEHQRQDLEEAFCGMAGLRLLLADDHRLMLAAVRRVFDRTDGFEIVGEVTRGSQVVPAVASLQPDVLLLDVRMPELDGIQCLERLRRHGLELPVVVVSSYADEAHVAAAREAGAAAYVVKTVDPARLVDVVRAVVTGASFITVMPAPVAGTAPGESLSERELTVLRALARGLSNREIARELWVSEQTVKFHLRNIYRKLEIASRTEAVGWAYAQGIASPLLERAATHP
jgi:DNA-binding NarL/FixJ family response regulator